MNFTGSLGGRRRRLVVACAVLGIATFGSAVALAEVADQVTIKQGKPPTSFTGTDKNTSATTHNAISIGTAGPSGQENNPITSFTYNGQACQLYAGAGSAYCSVSLAPGATATFSGTTQSPTTAFTFCTSDDGGEDNNCNGVRGSTGTTTSPATNCAPATLLQYLVFLDDELNKEQKAAEAGHLSEFDVERLEEIKKDAIKEGFSGQSIYGVPATAVIGGFAGVDYQLGKALGFAVLGNTHAAGIALGGAIKLKKPLESELKKEGKAPEVLLSYLAFLDDELNKEQKAAEAGHLSEFDVERLEEIKKDAIKEGFSGQSIYGVPATAVIGGFAGVDYQLGKALGFAVLGNTHAAGIALGGAIKLKKPLEKALEKDKCT